MIVVRMSQTSDLDSLLAFSQEAQHGISSLPNNPKFLEKRLEATEAYHKTGTHLFSLLDDGKVIGVSGFFRKGRRSAPMRVFEKHSLHLLQKEVGVDRVINFLQVTELPRPLTELGTLFLHPYYRGKKLGLLLSYARFLFMANFPKQVDPRVIASLRGVSDPDGRCPFWDGVGAHFYGYDYKQADSLRSEKWDIMTALLPKTPLYTALLPSTAQQVIGQIHPLTGPAMNMLLSQGFKHSPFVDLFDAGPFLQGHVNTIKAITHTVVAQVKGIEANIESSGEVIISNTGAQFLATRAPVLTNNRSVILNQLTADTLKVNLGDKVRYLSLGRF